MALKFISVNLIYGTDTLYSSAAPLDERIEIGHLIYCASTKTVRRILDIRNERTQI